MGKWAATMRVCATCRYWCGSRDVDGLATMFEAKEPYGMCAGPFGSFRGCQMNEGHSCSKWEKFRDD